MADMVVSAGVDAAGDIHGDRTDLILAADIRKALADGLRQGDRPCICQRAVIETGAGDNVARTTDVRRCEAVDLERQP